MTQSKSGNPFRLARRAARMNPSVIREILKLTEQPNVISLAGGLPSPEGFPVDALREASNRVMRDTPHAALQYAASEGYGPLREWIADHLRSRGHAVDASQVLITTGSQQGLDLIGKALIDTGSTVAVESPTYLGALQAFAPAEPEFDALTSDVDGPLPEELRRAAAAQFLYIQPDFQNPSGRCISETRRQELIAVAQAVGLPLVEDNPYGELWFEAPPPRPLATRWPEGSVYLGSFSKVLAPGLRVGYLVAPPALYPKLLQAKQAADLHTPGFNQRIVHEVVSRGLLDDHLPAVRERYRLRRDAMLAALEQSMPGGCRWVVPQGGMFFWIELPQGCDATAMLPAAVARGVAYVPGEAFFAAAASKNCLRLSFATASEHKIAEGIEALAGVLRETLAAEPASRVQETA